MRAIGYILIACALALFGGSVFADPPKDGAQATINQTDD